MKNGRSGQEIVFVFSSSNTQGIHFILGKHEFKCRAGLQETLSDLTRKPENESNIYRLTLIFGIYTLEVEVKGNFEKE